MSFYPILSAPDCAGWTTVFNFSPNNWEETHQISRYVNLTWTDGAQWHTQTLSRLKHGDALTVREGDVRTLLPKGALPLLSLSDAPVAMPAGRIAGIAGPQTRYPEWRATLGLESTSGAFTCYQGEVNPFPAPGSLLSFANFVQSGRGVENYLLFLNVETAPLYRVEKLEVRDATSAGRCVSTHEVRSNTISCVCLDEANIRDGALGLVTCMGMSGIPLYFSKTRKGDYLSLEHSHPPASTVIHGRRWDAQKLLKQLWFSKVS